MNGSSDKARIVKPNFTCCFLCVFHSSEWGQISVPKYTLIGDGSGLGEKKIL